VIGCEYSGSCGGSFTGAGCEYSGSCGGSLTGIGCEYSGSCGGSLTVTGVPQAPQNFAPSLSVAPQFKQFIFFSSTILIINLSHYRKRRRTSFRRVEASRICRRVSQLPAAEPGPEQLAAESGM